jgi:hypothetical protein
MTNRIFTLCALLLLIARAQTAAPAGVQAKLSLAENNYSESIGATANIRGRLSAS